MTERLLLAALLLVGIGLVGYLTRTLVVARSDRLAATAMLPGSRTATTRLLVFSTKFCADCAAQRQLIEEQRDTWGEIVEVSYHDAAKEGELAGRFGIVTVPALVVAAPDGRVVGVKQGLVDGDRLRSLIAAAA
jgi:hypothetical protein